MTQQIFIAHSLDHPDFGPAQNVHGATLKVVATIFRKKLNSIGVVIDIGYFNQLLNSILNLYDYGNLDELEEFENTITTIEYLCGYFHDLITTKLVEDGYELGPQSLCKLRLKIEESDTAWAVYEEDLRI